MANKKIIMSVTASAVIASTFAATQAEAASYKVQSGDSLWGIAQKYNTSVSQLKSINDLSSDLIFPNQIIETSKSSNSGKVESKPSANTSTTYTVKRGDTLSGIAAKYDISLSNLMDWNNLDTYLIYPGDKFVVSKSGKVENTPAPEPEKDVASASVYTVRSGDTLSGIAYSHDVTVSALKKWNNLSSDLIIVGQKLNIGSKGTSSGGSTGSVETPSADVDYSASKVVSIAKSMLGVDYQWGGTTPAGFDCSGFIKYVYEKAGMDISRTSSAGYFNRSYYVNNPQVGDLVFFENTYKAGISHMGIYLGNGEFIHAGSSGVEISPVHGKYYWGKHFDSYKRFY
ncbi:peptidoglycan endopeptidase [Virgibacillus phasianinus]|uniref:Peptidoglycan endopeptidase n=1 Tax=Virgibacillus phasianinus TaxID=2017483 RepID=A0A220U1Z7_9BACI|nr:LysM peptidoglycan-binding domain-containing protein [Virgibacillus phasianinus]ASK62274.1 peptidoglycan endopeptidase [Virgibacillus phasianinus]